MNSSAAGSDIARLAGALQDGEPRVRMAAALSLGTHGALAQPALKEYWTTARADAVERWPALIGLERINENTDSFFAEILGLSLDQVLPAFEEHDRFAAMVNSIPALNRTDHRFLEDYYPARMFRVRRAAGTIRYTSDLEPLQEIARAWKNESEFWTILPGQGRGCQEHCGFQPANRGVGRGRQLGWCD